MTSLINTQSDTPWRDRALSVHDRVEALLAAMTLEEKVAQLGSLWFGRDGAVSAAESAPDDVDELVRGGVGHLSRVFGTAPVTVAEGVERLRDLQERVVAGNRFGIPAIVHEECLTGFATYGATAYPAPLECAATFDVALVREMASAIGRDLRAVGVHQGLSPVLDVVRDYRWGRAEETLGEDPYLVGQLGAAYVRGLEEAGVIATLKHFAGHASSRAARNQAPVGIGPRELADMILPPFEVALRVGGARSVMHSYTDVEEALVDDSVRRVLRQKVELELPRRARIAVLGPCADDPLTLMGCYAFPNPVLHRYTGRGAGPPIATIGQQVQAEFPRPPSTTPRASRSPAASEPGSRKPIASPPWPTSPCCSSATALSVRSVTRPTCACRVCRTAWSRRYSRPARRPCWSWYPDGPTPWVNTPTAPPRWSRRSSPAWKAPRPSPSPSATPDAVPSRRSCSSTPPAPWPRS